MIKHSIFLFASHSLFALTTLVVSSHEDTDAGGFGATGELRYCLNTMNQNLNSSFDDYEIVFDSSMLIQLNGILPIINNSTNEVSITIGNTGSTPTVTLDGNSGLYSGFFIPIGNVTIQNMIFQNFTARGGNGGDGTSGGGGGMGAGGAIYVPQLFSGSSYPSVTLMNVLINDCSAEGGDGGSYFSVSSPTGNEGGAGGGGFSGNGGSITVAGITGGAGGGGFGGNGGDVTLTSDDPFGPAGGGGGGIGSRTSALMPENLGNGGSDADFGDDGNGYGLGTAGFGGGGYSGGMRVGGGGGGGSSTELGLRGGGGGGSSGSDGMQPQGNIPPGASGSPSGGNGGNGGGGGGGGAVLSDSTNNLDGEAGSGGYGGGGGGGAGLGSYDAAYTVKGGSGGVGGGGGGGGANQSGMTPSDGGGSLGGGGGGGGGPVDGSGGPGGIDVGMLGGGAGGEGAGNYGAGYGGGGGGGGSGIGGAIFVDSNLNFTIQAIPGVPTTFNTTGNTTRAGDGGSEGSGGGSSGFPGSALGDSIFLRTGSSLTFHADGANDLLTLGDGVAFVDDTSFGAGGTNVNVTGDGTVIYNGSTEYQGSIRINNANFKVNNLIDQADISVCRNIGFSPQRGTLSGMGTLTGDVFVNSGTISPDTGETLTLGSLSLSPAGLGALGSLVHIEIDSGGTSQVSVTGAASLAGILEIDLDPSAATGTYTVLTSSGISGSFDSVSFTGVTPSYTLSYLPMGSPTFVQFDLLSLPTSSLSTQGLRGNDLRVANYLNILAPDADSLGLTDQYELLNSLPFSQYEKALEAISPVRNSIASFVAQNMLFLFSESLDSHFTKRRLASKRVQTHHTDETALLADNELVADNQSPRNAIYAPPKNANSQIWAMGFGQFAHQNSQDQTPAFDFNSGGFFAAYDYGNSEQGCIGALAGYSYSSIHEYQSMGSGRLNAGYLSLYGMRSFSDFFIDAAIWGEYMSVDQKRAISFPGFDKTAKSSHRAEELDLHFGTGYDVQIHTGTIEPFALLDWVFEWDPSYSEKGAAPYNMKVSSRTSWMLRFETGLNGYNTTTYTWGIFIAQAKLSYVYKKPRRVGHVHAAIVSAPASFVVESFTTEQSLFSPAIELFWQTNWNGYGSISYDGEFGSGYSSNQFYGKIGYSF